LPGHREQQIKKGAEARAWVGNSELVGSSLSPLLRDGGEVETAGLRGRLIFHSHHRYASRGVVQYAVIELPRWKLTYTYHRRPVGPGWKRTRFALYDLRGGLYADEDVIDEHHEVARRLIGELLAYRQRWATSRARTTRHGTIDAPERTTACAVGMPRGSGR